MAKTDTLRATDIEGVYVNTMGVHVDRNGVAIAFKTLKKKEEDQRREVLGHDVKEPHELLKAIAMDPRYPLAVRLDCAHKAAPFYGRKLDGTPGTGTKSAEEMAADVMAALDAMDRSVGGKLPKAQGARK